MARLVRKVGARGLGSDGSHRSWAPAPVRCPVLPLPKPVRHAILIPPCTGKGQLLARSQASDRTESRALLCLKLSGSSTPPSSLLSQGRGLQRPVVSRLQDAHGPSSGFQRAANMLTGPGTVRRVRPQATGPKGAVGVLGVQGLQPVADPLQFMGALCSGDLGVWPGPGGSLSAALVARSGPPGPEL